MGTKVDDAVHDKRRRGDLPGGLEVPRRFGVAAVEVDDGRREGGRDAAHDEWVLVNGLRGGARLLLTLLLLLLLLVGWLWCWWCFCWRSLFMSDDGKTLFFVLFGLFLLFLSSPFTFFCLASIT